MARNKRSKYVKRLWKHGLFNDGVLHGYGLLRELHIEDGSGYRNFVRITKSDMEILLQKTGPRIQGKDTKFREAIPPSIRLAVTL
jgi:putative component of toxin-antitoxin plasmid stabilization module